MGIREWKEADRPREKMCGCGAASLGDSELIAILLRTGTKDLSAVGLSRKLLAEAGNSINGLAGFSMDRLCAVPGIGKTKAATLMAVFEIAKRIESEKLGPRPLVTDSKAAYRIIAPELRNLCHEECWVLYLNRAGKLISKERSSTGGIACTVMDTKKILKSAVEKSASSIIIAHNHPSGNPFPGEQDRKQTKLLKEAAAILDITLVDHIIVGKDGYFSFCDEGL